MAPDTADLTAQLIKDCAQAHLDASQYWLESIVDHATKDCESPIETLLAVALLFAPWPVRDLAKPFDASRPNDPIPCWMRSHWVRAGWNLEHEFEGRKAVIISPQQQLRGYRVDFLVLAKFDADSPAITRAVVECDGHEFHERTKEQAARDRARDRALQANGYNVFRFTGSEIYRDARRCAEEVVLAMSRLAGRP